MYNFVAKEIEYANYFQTASTSGTKGEVCNFSWNSLQHVCVCPPIGLAVAHRGSGGVSQEVFGDSAECAATDQSSAG